MKAAVFFGKHDLRVVDVPDPVPGPNDVRIKIAFCGVCGTDLHIYNGMAERCRCQPERFWAMNSAALWMRWAEVKALNRDRVSVDPNEWCGECYFCKNARAHFCTQMKGFGTTYPGGFVSMSVSLKSRSTICQRSSA